MAESPERAASVFTFLYVCFLDVTVSVVLIIETYLNIYNVLSVYYVNVPSALGKSTVNKPTSK